MKQYIIALYNQRAQLKTKLLTNSTLEDLALFTSITRRLQDEVM